MKQKSSIAGSDNVVVQFVGDGNRVNLNRPTPRLTLSRYEQRRMTASYQGNRPDTEILRAYSRSIPLVGRENDLKLLRDWLANGEAISVLAITGAAGRGKTRLALDLCETVAEQGWQSGFLTPDDLVRIRTQQSATAWEWDSPCLVVVDYVASHARQLHDWLVELADNRARSEKSVGRRRPLRVLLLERQGDTLCGWWQTIFGYGGADTAAVRDLLNYYTTPLELPPITDPEARRSILNAVLELVGCNLNVPESDEDPHFYRKLAELSWGGEPLFLMMAGLTAAKEGLAGVLSLSRADLATSLAADELSRIERIAKSQGIPEHAGEFTRHMVAVVTLCQGLSREQAHSAIEREQKALKREGVGDVATVFAALKEAMPHPDGGLAPVQPDILGEASLLQVWKGCDGRDGGAPAVRAHKDSGANVTASVIRACEDFTMEGFDQPIEWLKALHKSAGTSDELFDLAGSLFHNTSIPIYETALEITCDAAESMRTRHQQTGDDVDRGRLGVALNFLGCRLNDIHRNREALNALNEAETIFKQLVADEPIEAGAWLAASYGNKANVLAALGEYQEAGHYQHRAFLKYAELVELGERSLFGYALSALVGLSNRFAEIGNQKEALYILDGFLPLAREIKRDGNDNILGLFANALNTRSTLLGHLGRYLEAEQSLDEAVGIRRVLAAEHPSVHREQVADSLINLTYIKIELRKFDEALEKADEAQKIYRSLERINPSAIIPKSAAALRAMSDCLGQLGKHEEALSTIRKAVLIRRSLFKENPNGYRYGLGSDLDALCRHLASVGRIEEAIVVGQEAARHLHIEAKTSGNRVRPYLASLVARLAELHGQVGHARECLTAATDALRTILPALLEHPSVHRKRGQSVLDTYGRACSAFGQPADLSLLASVAKALAQTDS